MDGIRHVVSAGDLPPVDRLVLGYWVDTEYKWEAAFLTNYGKWKVYDGEWAMYVEFLAPNYWWELPEVEQ